MKKTIFVALCVAVLVFVALGCHAQEKMPSNSGGVASSESTGIHSSEDSSVSSSTGELSGEFQDISDEEPTDNDWQFDLPENHGVDGEILNRFHAAIKDTNIYSVVVVKDGYIIDEYYKDDYNESSVFRLASCTKSFSGALIGIAIDKGQISGVDAKLTNFFKQLADSDDMRRQKITIEHLLTHTSGIEWYEWNGGNMFRQFTGSENWVDFVLSRPMAAEPGAVFNYTTGGSHLLAAIIQQATGEVAGDFAREHLFKPLGMDSVVWRSDPQGITDGGNGISMTARDAAKFGQLYLNGGRWKGRQVISDEWVNSSIEVQAAGSPGTGEYGYSWWLKQFGDINPYSVYYAMGHGGQYIFVVPQLNLVTVITGRFQDTYVPQYYFGDYIIKACS